MPTLDDVGYLDIESDDLLYSAKTIWCIVTKVKGKYYIYLKHRLEGLSPNHVYYYSMDDYLEQVVKGVGHLVIHNGISFDLPLLAKLHNFEYNISSEKITDTHILSRLYYPDREGHSLGWWGEKLRFKKGEYSDWSRLTTEMVEYCIQDVNVLERIDAALKEEAKGWDWSEAISLEYDIWHVQMKQEMKGVLFDAAKAEELLGVVSEEIATIEDKAIEEIPMNYKDEGEVRKVFLKNGEYTQSVKTWLGAA